MIILPHRAGEEMECITCQVLSQCYTHTHVYTHTRNAGKVSGRTEPRTRRWHEQLCISQAHMCEPAFLGPRTLSLRSCQGLGSAYFLPLLPPPSSWGGLGVLACQGTMGPQPLPAHCVRRSCRKETHLPVGLASSPLMSAPGTAGDPPCCSRRGGTCALQASHSGYILFLHLDWPPHPPQRHSRPAPQGLGWVLLHESRALFSLISAAAGWPGQSSLIGKC